jgi:hypothetical protein
MSYWKITRNAELDFYLVSQDKNQLVCQDLNESTLDLSLGLKAHDNDHGPDSKTDPTRGGQ